MPHNIADLLKASAEEQKIAAGGLQKIGAAVLVTVASAGSQNIVELPKVSAEGQKISAAELQVEAPSITAAGVSPAAPTSSYCAMLQAQPPPLSGSAFPTCSRPMPSSTQSRSGSPF